MLLFRRGLMLLLLTSSNRANDVISNDFRVKVAPQRVRSLNQFNFPSAFPLFDVLLALDRVLDGFVYLVPNKHVDSVPFRESVSNIVLVFPNSLNQV